MIHRQAMKFCRKQRYTYIYQPYRSGIAVKIFCKPPLTFVALHFFNLLSFVIVLLFLDEKSTKKMLPLQCIVNFIEW